MLARLRQAPGGYGGLLFVRTYGTEDDFEPFFAAIKTAAAGLLLVDDRCVCRPRFDPPGAGAADVLLYSTGYAKAVDVGFGGFAHLKQAVPYESRELPYRQEDLDRLTADYKSAIEQVSSLNYTDGDWLDTRLPSTPFDEYRDLVESRIDASYEKKHRINAIYRQAIPRQARLDDRFQDWRFHVRVPDKRRLIDAIFGQGLFASSHYADLTPVFAGGAAPRAAGLHRQVVNLFNDRYFSEEQARRVAGLVREHLAAAGPI